MRTPQVVRDPSLPERVTIYEVGPRDGLQNEPGVVPTEDDVEAALVSLEHDPSAGSAVPDPWGTVVRVRSADHPYDAGE